MADENVEKLRQALDAKDWAAAAAVYDALGIDYVPTPVDVLGSHPNGPEFALKHQPVAANGPLRSWVANEAGRSSHWQDEHLRAFSKPPVNHPNFKHRLDDLHEILQGKGAISINQYLSSVHDRGYKHLSPDDVAGALTRYDSGANAFAYALNTMPALRDAVHQKLADQWQANSDQVPAAWTQVAIPAWHKLTPQGRASSQEVLDKVKSLMSPYFDVTRAVNAIKHPDYKYALGAKVDELAEHIASDPRGPEVLAMLNRTHGQGMAHPLFSVITHKVGDALEKGQHDHWTYDALQKAFNVPGAVGTAFIPDKHKNFMMPEEQKQALFEARHNALASALDSGDSTAMTDWWNSTKDPEFPQGLADKDLKGGFFERMGEHVQDVAAAIGSHPNGPKMLSKIPGQNSFLVGGEGHRQVLQSLASYLGDEENHEATGHWDAGHLSLLNPHAQAHTNHPAYEAPEPEEPEDDDDDDYEDNSKQDKADARLRGVRSHRLFPAMRFWDEYETDTTSGHHATVHEMMRGHNPGDDYKPFPGWRGHAEGSDSVLVPHLKAYAKAIQDRVMEDDSIPKKMIRGKPHVLLWRGVGGKYAAEIAKAAYEAGAGKKIKIPVSSLSSWSTSPASSTSFCNTRAYEDVQRPAKALISKYFPVEHIVNSIMHPIGAQRHAYEHEKEITIGHPEPHIHVQVGTGGGKSARSVEAIIHPDDKELVHKSPFHETHLKEAKEAKLEARKQKLEAKTLAKSLLAMGTIANEHAEGHGETIDLPRPEHFEHLHPPRVKAAKEEFERDLVHSPENHAPITSPEGMRGITKKSVYQHPSGKKYMVKSQMNENRKLAATGPFEVLSQHLYHSAGIGHMHHDVHFGDAHGHPVTVVHVEKPRDPKDPSGPMVERVQDFNRHQLKASPSFNEGLAQIHIMDHLLGNDDRHNNNYLVKFDGRRTFPLAIDNTSLGNAHRLGGTQFKGRLDHVSPALNAQKQWWTGKRMAIANAAREWFQAVRASHGHTPEYAKRIEASLHTGFQNLDEHFFIPGQEKGLPWDFFR